MEAPHAYLLGFLQSRMTPEAGDAFLLGLGIGIAMAAMVVFAVSLYRPKIIDGGSGK